jgi:hypothetical protein
MTKEAKTSKPFKTLTLSHLPDFQPTALALDAWGGRTDRREPATGFFRVQRIDGRWHLIDPLGGRFLSVGVNSVKVADPPENPTAFATRFHDRKGWAELTHEDLTKLGFNSIGCWSDAKAFKDAQITVPWTAQWNLMSRYAATKKVVKFEYGHTGYLNDCIPAFDPEFVEFCEREAKELRATKDDPSLLGHFSDNELPLKRTGIIHRYLALPETDAGHRKAREWLAAHNLTPEHIQPADDGAFAAMVIARYYEVVSAAIRRNDPNHLFLGSRFHGFNLVQDETFTACAPYLDVISINYYGRWTPDQAELDHWASLSGRPLLVTEWYAKGDDAGLDDKLGAGFSVATQAERGKMYENFTIGLLRNRNCVGWHWFRWTDDVSKSPSNKGVYSGEFTPYVPLAQAMTAINKVVYRLQDYLDGARSPNLLDRRNEIGALASENQANP